MSPLAHMHREGAHEPRMGRVLMHGYEGCATVGFVLRRARLALVLSMVVGSSACGEPGAAKPEPKTDPAADPKPEITSTQPADRAPAPKTNGEPTAAVEPIAAASNELAFMLEGQERRFAVQEPGHATINRLSAPPSVAIIARDAGSSETLIIKLGGTDLDRASLPLELRMREAGGLSVTYVDPNGTRSSGRVGDAGAEDHLTIDAWDPAQRRLRGRFAFTVSVSGTTRALTRGSLDVVLSDPFDR